MDVKHLQNTRAQFQVAYRSLKNLIQLLEVELEFEDTNPIYSYRVRKEMRDMLEEAKALHGGSMTRFKSNINSDIESGSV